MLSENWRRQTSTDKCRTLSILLLSPFSSAFVHLRWLVKFESADNDTFYYLHHNSRLSKLLNVSFESPLQIVILMCLWGNGALELPWFKDMYITDSHGRELCSGKLPAIISLTTSCLSILFGSIDICEERSFIGGWIAFVFAFSNYLFRLPTIAFLILYFHEWGIAIFLSLFLVSFILIIRRYQKLNRQIPERIKNTRKNRKEQTQQDNFDNTFKTNISIPTSILISPISPFIAPDQANLYQRTDIYRNDHTNETENKYRRQLSAMISMATLFILYLSLVILYLLLVYKNEFITSSMESTLVMDKEKTMRVFSKVLLPLGGFILILNMGYILALWSR